MKWSKGGKGKGGKGKGKHAPKVTQAELNAMLKRAMKSEGMKVMPDKKAEAKTLAKIQRAIRGGRKPGRIIGRKDDDGDHYRDA